MEVLNTSTEALRVNEFKRHMWIVTWVTLVLPPLTGIFMLSFVGVFPFPEVMYPFADYSLLVVLIACVLGITITRNFIHKILQLVQAPSEFHQYQKKLKRLPIYYFSLLFLYFAVGLVSDLYSLSTLHGYNYPLEKYLISFLGVIPGGLITALPIFFYLTDSLGRFLAPHGIQVSVAPIKLKLIVLGLFVPVLIDTLLIMYFHDRTGYLSAETIGIWFFLIIIAAVGTFMAWKSFRQSLSPFVNALEADGEDHFRVNIIPQSLDELGLLSHRWHQLWQRVLDYEVRLANSNISLQSDVQQRTNELESERLFINKVLENATALILVLNREGHIVRFNPAFEKITGFTFAELHNRPIWEWLIPPEQIEDVQQVFNKLTDAGLDSKYENDLMTRDGGRVLITWNNSAIRDEAGKVQYIVSIGIDISDRHAAQQAIEEARDIAEKASHAKSEFLSRMSHELRTPMNAILGFGQLLQMDNDNLEDRQKEHIKEVMQGANHLLELINEILDLAKIEEGKFDTYIESVPVSIIINESVSLLMPMAKQSNILIVNNVPPKTRHMVQADRLRLKQVIINLLSNAIKYNHTNGSVYIDINQPKKDALRISVRDTGPGIAPDQLNKLFTPFERLDAASNQYVEGTGIGLALSKRLIELMQGSIGFDNQPGVGCSFFIELPYEGIEQDYTKEITADAQPSLSEAPETVHQYTVLYVEDNPPNLRLVSSAMGIRPDIKLISAHTGPLGLEMAIAHLPDLILLDINLPGISGLEIIHKLKQQKTTQAIPVFAVTANAMPDEIEAGKKAGFIEYLTKPLNIGYLHKLLHQYLPEKPADKTPN